MDKLNKVLKNKQIKRSNRGVYEWQDMAARYAEKLSITPSTAWFKFFKMAFKEKRQGLLSATYSAVVEIIPPNAERYFYKVYYNKLNEK